MKKMVWGIGIFFILVEANLLWGSTPEALSGKIAYVDIQRALNQSETGKEAKKRYAQEVEKMEKKLNERQEELKRLRETLEKQKALLNPEVREEKEKDYQVKLRDFQRLMKDSQDELQQKETELIKKILQEIVELIKKLGKEKGYSLILEKNENILLYSSEALDLTDQVIKAYNEQYKSGK